LAGRAVARRQREAGRRARRAQPRRHASVRARAIRAVREARHAPGTAAIEPLVVVREPWRAHPLAWIHRAEARGIARELGVGMVTMNGLPLGRRLLLRLSDPEMLRVASELARAGVAYLGP